MRASTRDGARTVESSAGRTWRARPVLATSVRIAVFTLPIAASAVAASVVAHLLPRPTSTASLVVWWVVVLATCTAVLLVVQRAARRLLPLSALLRLTLLFPDRAPKRFALVLRSGNTATLRGGLEVGGDDPHQDVAVALALAAALTAHHAATRGHAERVRAFVELIADELALSASDRDQLRWASLLHDIGKLSVPPELLGSAEPLDDDGWRVLKQHPVEGARLTSGLGDWLGPWTPTIVQHHERWDGAGYPHGLAGEHICLGARITSVADSFEVMTGARAYQRRRSAAEAREELATYSGTQFDPAVVRAFLNVSLGKLERAMGPAAWVAEIPLVGNLARIVPETAAVAGQVAAAAAVVAVGAVGALAAPADSRPSPAQAPAATVRAASVEGASVTRSAGDGSTGPASPTTTAPSTSGGTAPVTGAGTPPPRTTTATTAASSSSTPSLPITPAPTVPTAPPPTTLPPTVPTLPLIGPILPTTTTTQVPVPTVTLPPVTLPPATIPSVTTTTTITLPPTPLP